MAQRLGDDRDANSLFLNGWRGLTRARRSLAAALVVLSAGGLVLARTPASSLPGGVHDAPETHVVVAGGTNAATFSGPGVHGRFALSHGAILAGGERQVFAEIDLAADASSTKERAPLALAIALDTSGSMEGEKIEGAKRACVQMIRDMRDDDEVAFVRYASDTELVQPLARVGNVRSALIARIERIRAGGGTDIPPALRRAAEALAEAGRGRVKRVVLASDGLDSTRALAEQYATSSAKTGVTISSMGIGLDFDEAYMGGVARAGRGNFGFVKDGASLATFLHRELEETAKTTAENVTVQLHLPAGVRVVQAHGCEVRTLTNLIGSGEIELAVGSMFAGDEQRVIVELAATAGAGDVLDFHGATSWSAVGGDRSSARFTGVSLVGSTDALAVGAARDGAVLANATSVVASAREVEAANAYARGDGARARGLIQQNMDALATAAAAAPSAAAPQLRAQAGAYKSDLAAFNAPAGSEEGNAAAKGAAAKNMANSRRAVGF